MADVEILDIGRCVGVGRWQMWRCFMEVLGIGRCRGFRSWQMYAFSGCSCYLMTFEFVCCILLGLHNHNVLESILEG